MQNSTWRICLVDKISIGCPIRPDMWQPTCLMRKRRPISTKRTSQNTLLYNNIFRRGRPGPFQPYLAASAATTRGAQTQSATRAIVEIAWRTAEADATSPCAARWSLPPMSFDTCTSRRARRTAYGVERCFRFLCRLTLLCDATAHSHRPWRAANSGAQVPLVACSAWPKSKHICMNLRGHQPTVSRRRCPALRKKMSQAARCKAVTPTHVRRTSAIGIPGLEFLCQTEIQPRNASCPWRASTS